jgi:hypothetical protein
VGFAAPTTRCIRMELRESHQATRVVAYASAVRVFTAIPASGIAIRVIVSVSCLPGNVASASWGGLVSCPVAASRVFLGDVQRTSCPTSGVACGSCRSLFALEPGPANCWFRASLRSWTCPLLSPSDLFVAVDRPTSITRTACIHGPAFSAPSRCDRVRESRHTWRFQASD